MKNLNNFGEALELLKLGKKVARKGWNGKGMWLYYVPANGYEAQTDVAKREFGECVPYQAYINIKTVDDTVVPWFCSQTDMFASDWIMLD